MSLVSFESRIVLAYSRSSRSPVTQNSASVMATYVLFFLGFTGGEDLTRISHTMQLHSRFLTWIRELPSPASGIADDSNDGSKAEVNTMWMFGGCCTLVNVMGPCVVTY